MKTKLLLLIIAIFNLNAISQNFEWATKISSSNDIPTSIAKDAFGDIYITGYSITSTSNTMFLRKNNANGTEIWTKFINPSANRMVQGLSVAVDISGNIYVSGTFTGSADFDPGTGVYMMSAVARNQNGFILKLDNTGNFVWAKEIDGPEGDVVKSIAVDGLGNVYTTGSFKGNVDFDPGSGITTLSAGALLDKSDMFVQKLDINGNFLWAINAGASNHHAEGNAIKVDHSGNVYTTGYFEDSDDFDPGSGITILTSGGGRDTFIQKLDSNGQFLWAKSIIGGSNNLSTSIVINTLSGNIFIAGYFEGTTDFNPSNAISYNLTANSRDAYTLKLTANGDFGWARQIGGVGFDVAEDITIDDNGDVLTTGYFQNTVDFNPESGVFNITSNGGYDAFIQKLTKDQGSLIWAIGTGDANAQAGRAIITHIDKIYTTGNFEGSVDFDPTSGTFTLNAVSQNDVYIQSLSDPSLGINDNNDLLKDFIIYPNPVKNTLTIQSKEIFRKVEVFSLFGQKLLESTHSTINITQFSTGMYLLKVFSIDGDIGFKRFMKE